jgi:hypothetical protein
VSSLELEGTIGMITADHRSFLCGQGFNLLLLLLLLLLMQLSFHSVAVVLKLVETKQKRINIHTRNNTKNTVKTIENKIITDPEYYGQPLAHLSSSP